MKKLIKLNDQHYIIVDDSEIKKDDYVFQQNFEKTNNLIIKIENEFEAGIANDKESSFIKRKITHSTQLLENVQTIFLSEIEEVINRYPTYELFKKVDGTCEKGEYEHWLFEKGFKAHQELVKDKMIVNDSQMMDIMDICVRNRGLFRGEILLKIKEYLLPKTEWDIEIDEQNKITLI